MANNAVSVGVDIADLLQNVVVSEKLKNAKIKIQSGSEAGDGYLGINSAVEITSDDRVLKLFVKASPARADLPQLNFLRDAFVNETYFYENIYPEYVKFQAEKGMEIYYPMVPKLYAATTENLKEAIVMENLKEQGYMTFDRRLTMNVDHITFVFKHFARFHAVSFAFKDQKYELYKKFSSSISNGLQNMEANGADKMFIKLCDNVKDMFAEDKFISKNIRNITEILMDVMLNITKHRDKYSIITQGDCWCNNMMFKYADVMDKTCPSDMKLIDWQMPSTNYPVFDMSYFFYTISSKQIMANHDQYLEIYHDELSKHMRQLGSDPEVLYPYSVLLEQWKRFSKYGLLMAILVVKIMLTEKDQVVNVSKNADGEVFNYKLKNEATYKQRIRDILEHFILNKYL